MTDAQLCRRWICSRNSNHCRMHSVRAPVTASKVPPLLMASDVWPFEFFRAYCWLYHLYMWLYTIAATNFQLFQTRKVMCCCWCLLECQGCRKDGFAASEVTSCSLWTTALRSYRSAIEYEARYWEGWRRETWKVLKMDKENAPSLDTCQYVGPYRLEKTLGKGQTGECWDQYLIQHQPISS